MIENTNESALVGVLEQVLHHHFTHALQGLLPPTINPQKLNQVLDVNCRIGAWAVDLALSYPGLMVTGIDNDAQCVDMARQSAEVAGLNRVRFYQANPLEPLPFADNTFDLVHMSLLMPAFRPVEWPIFLQECKRVLKPEGILNVVSLSLGLSSSEAYQRLVMLIDQLLCVLGYGFSDRPGTSSPGVYLSHLLCASGFENSTYIVRPVNFGGLTNSSGRACCQLLLNNVRKMKHFFPAHNIIDGEELDLLLTQKQRDIVDSNFCAAGALISVMASK